MSNLKQQIEQAVLFIQKKFQIKPKIAIVFGSALADRFLSQIEKKKTLTYKEIPHFKTSTVPGHANRLHCGFFKEVPLLIAEGRVHYYEGYSFEEVTLPIRVFSNLGIEELFLTNAAGALNSRFALGDLVFISDHLNLSGVNPLHGFREESLGARFVDLSNAYDPFLLKKLGKIAQKEKIKTQKGIYTWIAGPSYETKAEVKMFRKLGGDVIGMSTVPEVIVARQIGLKLAAISCVTNLLGSSKKVTLSHEEVMDQAKKNQKQLSRLLEKYLTSFSSS